MSTDRHRRPPRRPRCFEDAERLDLAVYAAIARTPTPALDLAMAVCRSRRLLAPVAGVRRLCSRSPAAGPADGRRHGRFGRRSPRRWSTPRRAARRRRRPDRLAGEVPVARHVRMPTRARFRPVNPPPRSRSRPARPRVPGGRSPAARARGAGWVLARPHRVHYPGDVLAGPLIGTTVGQLTTHAGDHRRSARTA